MLQSAFQDITNISYKRIKLTIHKSAHRKKLLRWIYEVCRDFNYSIYTYTAATLIIDKYTEKNGFQLNEYQLIGISSLFLAAKIEESKTKSVSEYSTITDNAFSVESIITKEQQIFESLDHNLLMKLPQFFFNLSYFQSNFATLCLEEKLELLNCFIAAKLEERSFSKNVFVLYLESKREMEHFMEKTYRRIPEALRFYIENNIKLCNILERMNK